MMYKLIAILAICFHKDIASTLYLPDLQCPEDCMCTSQIVNCDSLNLNEMPLNIDTNVEILHLNNNNLKTLPHYNFNKLHDLNLSTNALKTLHDNSFSSMTNLQILDLSNNQLTNWQVLSSLRKLNKLTFLDLSHNSFVKFTFETSFSFNELRILHLDSVSITSLQNRPLHRLFPNLEEFYFRNNPLSKIPPLQFQKLKYLDFSGCEIASVDVNAFNSLPNLLTLVLQGNKRLQNLTIQSPSLSLLNASYSKLSEVPTGNLNSVETVNLKHNSITELKETSFINYSKLKRLDLSENQISVLGTNTFNYLGDLEELNLAENKITTIPDVFLANQVLTKVNLSGNRLEELDFTCSSLEVLDVSHCKINRIRQDSLSQIPELRVLKMGFNPDLTGLPDGLSSEHLTELDVQSCRISSISNQTLTALKSLRVLILSNNLLTTIDSSDFPHGLSLKIRDNPWHCDCKKLRAMFFFYEDSLEDNFDMNELVCSSPEKGVTWLTACRTDWYSEERKTDPVWVYSVGIVVAMVTLMIVALLFNKVHTIKKERDRQLERERQAEEREALRRADAIRIAEEADQNAPDPRELQRPPAYSEAIKLPPLSASYLSLNGSVHSLASRQSLSASANDISKRGRTRRKRRRRRSTSSDGTHRSSRIVLDSDTTSDPDSSQPRRALESDF